LHFNGNFGLTGSKNGLGIAVGFDFWNEYRKYLGRNDNWFLSIGFTANTGYSNLSFNENQNLSGYNIGLGYKLGIGYKINERFTLTGTTNPRLNYQLLDRNGIITNRLQLQAPVNFGVNYRF